MARKEIQEKKLNLFAPSKPHTKQQEVLDALDSGSRWVMLRAGRKFRKTSLLISWALERAIKTGLTVPYVAPNRVQAKNIVWDDHIPRILNHFKEIKFPYKLNETALTVEVPSITPEGLEFVGGKIQLHGVENAEALRGISNWCFPAWTLIDTRDGLKRIQDITTDDEVRTPSGYKKVLKSGETRKVTELNQVIFSDGSYLESTPNHEVFTNSGLQPIDELRYNSVIWNKKYHLPSISMESPIGYKEMVKSLTITDPEDSTELITFIEQSGEVISERYQKDIIFTIKTETDLITLLRICNSSLLLNTQESINNNAGIMSEKECLKSQEKIWKKLTSLITLRLEKKIHEGILKKLDQQQQNGMDQKKEETGTLKEDLIIGKTGSIPRRIAKSVVKNICRLIQKDLNTVPHVVEIKSLSYKEEIPVYDLTVKEDHCYFANGFLVSNSGFVGDEYDDWEEDIWPLIIRPNLIPHQAPAIMAGTPKGYSNLWRLENPKEGKSMFQSFHFTSYDNPDLQREELEALVKEYKSMGEGYFRQEILAEYERPYGTVYEEWSETHFTEFDYDPFLPLHITMDFGVNDPTAIIWIQPNKGEFRVIDYYETADASVEHFAQVIRSKPYKKPDLITGDAAGKARSIVTNTSPIEEYAKYGLYIKTKDGLQIPDQVRITHKYIPSLYVNKNTAERFRDCLINYRYPTKKDSALNQSNEIPVHNQFSHGLRALEYYFANIDGGNMFKDNSGQAAINKMQRKKWSIG